MSMNIVDILIVIFVLLGAFVGAKQGFTKALVSFLGIIIVVVIAYFLKNPVSELLMSVGPFFNFGGIIKGVTVLNIAVYEIIAFVLVFACCSKHSAIKLPILSLFVLYSSVAVVTACGGFAPSL